MAEKITFIHPIDRISVQFEFKKNYDKRAADKLDGQVFDAMNKA